jgi:hypothetical protein
MKALVVKYIHWLCKEFLVFSIFYLLILNYGYPDRRAIYEMISYLYIMMKL